MRAITEAMSLDFVCLDDLDSVHVSPVTLLSHHKHCRRNSSQRQGRMIYEAGTEKKPQLISY